MNASLRGLAWLTGAHAQRLLREGIILRSLLFPVTLTVLVLGATVAAVVFQHTQALVVVSPAVHTDALKETVERLDGRYEVGDPTTAVADLGASIATDGTTLWLGERGQPPQALEAAVRHHIGAMWAPYDPRRARVQRASRNEAPTHVARFLGALFAMYGVVFGAGSIARDRDEGTLDAELCVALPVWVNGLARWAAATLVLAVYFAMSVAVLHAVIGVDDPVRLAVAGAAASAASAALGMIVIGRSGLDRSFAAPMSAGLVAVVSLLSWGYANPTIAPHLPIASLFGPADGAAPVVGLLAGPFAALVFARRTATG